MDWVKLPHFDNISDDDKPILLTEKEVDYILSHIPPFRAAHDEIAKVARDGVISYLKSEMLKKPLAPSGVGMLIEEVVSKHNRSVIIPGTPVGITAGEAVGASSTQMTLNTFHASGSAKSASFGIEAMKDIILARKNRKTEICTVYYTNKTISYEEVLNSREFIVGSVVTDFIAQLGVDSTGAKKYRTEILDVKTMEKFWWHDMIDLFIGKPVPNSKKILRLFLNVNEMYKHRVTIGHLAKVLEKENPTSIVAVYGPISDGIIDIYPVPKVIKSVLEEKVKELRNIPDNLLEVTFLDNCVEKELENIKVKGVSGIKKLQPVISPVLRTILSERRVNDNDPEKILKAVKKYKSTAWILNFNRSMMKTTGIESINLQSLCETAGLKVIGFDDGMDPSFMVISMSTMILVNTKGNKSPYQLLTEDIGEEEKLEINGMYLHERRVNQDDASGPLSSILSPNIGKLWVMYAASGRSRELKGLLEKVAEIIDIPENVKENFTLKFGKPTEFINTLIAREKAKYSELRIKMENERFKEAESIKNPAKKKEFLRAQVDLPRPDIVKAGEFVIAETIGSNLIKLLSQRGIDKKRTICNNVHTIASVLGIEAARGFYSRELYETIANSGLYVHPSHCLLIGDFATSRGAPHGVTFTGVSRQPVGYLSLATLEKALKVFSQAGLHSQSEDIRSVSASVVVGERIAIGTGAFDVQCSVTSEEGEDGEMKFINSDCFKAFENAASSKAPVEISQKDITSALEDLGNLATEEYNLGGGEEDENIIPTELVQDTTRGVVSSTSIPKQSELLNILNQVKIGRPIDEEHYFLPSEKLTSIALIDYDPQLAIKIDQGIPEELLRILREESQEPAEEVEKEVEEEIEEPVREEVEEEVIEEPPETKKVMAVKPIDIARLMKVLQ